MPKIHATEARPGADLCSALGGPGSAVQRNRGGKAARLHGLPPAEIWHGARLMFPAAAVHLQRRRDLSRWRS